MLFLQKEAEPHFDRTEELGHRHLALRLVTLIRYVLLQMRNLMWFVIYGYFLAVVSVTFYPFQGGKNLSDMLGVIFVIVLVIMAFLVTGVLRNPMLKRLEEHETNMASILEACVHMLSVGGLPALGPSLGGISRGSAACVLVVEALVERLPVSDARLD